MWAPMWAASRRVDVSSEDEAPPGPSWRGSRRVAVSSDEEGPSSTFFFYLATVSLFYLSHYSYNSFSLDADRDKQEHAACKFSLKMLDGSYRIRLTS